MGRSLTQIVDKVTSRSMSVREEPNGLPQRCTGRPTSFQHAMTTGAQQVASSITGCVRLFVCGARRFG